MIYFISFIGYCYLAIGVFNYLYFVHIEGMNKDEVLKLLQEEGVTFKGKFK